MKHFLTVIKIVSLFLPVAITVVVATGLLYESILFQSLESKTMQNEPVFNKIKWFSFPEKDVWMMNQSHQGINATSENWDRLAIIIDKKAKQKTAQFLQLQPGPLIWSDDLLQKRIPYKVSCFICHSNGLRAIRPQWNPDYKNNFKQQIQVAIINLKIKSYGRIIENAAHTTEDLKLAVPFRHQAQMDNEVLTLPLCIRCHKESQDLVRDQFVPS